MEQQTNSNDRNQGAKRQRFVELALSCIETNLLTLRKDPAEDDGGLAESIACQGLIHPVTVIAQGDGQYLLIGGSRRLAACRQLGWTTIACHVLEVPEDEAGLVSFSENYFRKDRHPVEEARLLKHLKNRTGCSDAELAQRMGQVASVVTERLNILVLPPEILAQVQDRPDSPLKLSHAVVLSKLMRSGRPDCVARVHELKNKILGHRLTKAELRGLVRLITEPVEPGGTESRYDRLPERLRKLLTTDRSMTVGMAEFYLAPERSVGRPGEQGQRLRDAAARVNPRDLEALIVHAVGHLWTLEETKREFAKQLDDQLLKEKRWATPHRPLCEVFAHITKLNHALTFLNQETLLDGVRIHEIQHIRQATRRLVDQLQTFLEDLQPSVEPIPMPKSPLELALAS